jgi:hypothetical protein
MLSPSGITVIWASAKAVADKMTALLKIQSFMQQPSKVV